MAEAQAALHDLLTGRAVAMVRDQSGDMIQYSRADIGKLRAYIQELKNETQGRTSAPLKVWF